MTQTSNPFLPIEYQVHGRSAAVLGADAHTLPKVTRLLEAGATVTIYECGRPRAATFDAMVGNAAVTMVSGFAKVQQLDPCCVVFVSPAEAVHVAGLHKWARDNGRLFCVLDRPELSTFANPAVLHAGGLRLRVASAGASPGLVKRVREDLAQLLGDPRLERFVARLADMRKTLPRGQRAERMSAAVKGFTLHGTVQLPAWFEEGQDPP